MPTPRTPAAPTPTAPHDSLETNRRLEVVAAASIPKVPAGFVATPGDVRLRRLTRPAEGLRAEIVAALAEVVGRKATYRSELGDVPPDLAQAEVLHPRIGSLHDAREAAEALAAYLRELEEIAFSDATDFLDEVSTEVVHRARRNGALSTAYSRVLALTQARSQAISDGIARSRRDREGAEDAPQPPAPADGR